MVVALPSHDIDLRMKKWRKYVKAFLLRSYRMWNSNLINRSTLVSWIMLEIELLFYADDFEDNNTSLNQKSDLHRDCVVEISL